MGTALLALRRFVVITLFFHCAEFKIFLPDYTDRVPLTILENLSITALYKEFLVNPIFIKISIY